MVERSEINASDVYVIRTNLIVNSIWLYIFFDEVKIRQYGNYFCNSNTHILLAGIVILSFVK
jgi:hypothetical protein